MKREFPQRPKTEVFVNRAGNIVISQTDDMHEALVWFDAEQVDTLIEWLQDAKREREQDWQPDEAGEEDDEEAKARPFARPC